MLTDEEKVQQFEEYFYRDLEKWFSADIACCDNCYDEFVAKWPGTYISDLDFQRNSIDLECFYSGSYLQDYYTLEEFKTFIGNIRCPECSSPLAYNIWPYNFPFNDPLGYELISEEIAVLTKKTPFLVLSHPFAKKVFDAILKLGQQKEAHKVEEKYYRARYAEQLAIPTPNDFDKPPSEFTAEGRYNHAGMPVLYLGSEKKVCFLELGGEKAVAIAELSINIELKILDLLQMVDCIDNEELLTAMIHSSLLSAPKTTKGWHNPQYAFSRFVADCAKHSGFQAIRYPSTKTSHGHNLVIFGNDENFDDLFVCHSISSYQK